MYQETTPSNKKMVPQHCKGVYTPPSTLSPHSSYTPPSPLSPHSELKQVLKTLPRKRTNPTDPRFPAANVQVPGTLLQIPSSLFEMMGVSELTLPEMDDDSLSPCESEERCEDEERATTPGKCLIAGGRRCLRKELPIELSMSVCSDDEADNCRADDDKKKRGSRLKPPTRPTPDEGDIAATLPAKSNRNKSNKEQPQEEEKSCRRGMLPRERNFRTSR